MAAAHHPEGYAAPLVFIYTRNGQLITDTKGVSIGHECISFEYVYDEEEDEECNIVIQTKNKFLPDNPQLQVKKNLIVQWGYNTSDGGQVLSPKRYITIRDVETKYGPTSIKYKLKCTDCVAQLKEVKTRGIMQDHFVNWLSEIIEPNGFTATLHLNSSNLINYNLETPDIEVTSGEGTFKNITLARENAKAPVESGVFYGTQIIKGQSKAIHAAIEDQIKQAEGGPYFLDGRDCNLNIRNRNYNQLPQWEFHYYEEPGDIISFAPRTTYKKSQLEKIETGLIDGFQKTMAFASAAYLEPEDLVFGAQGQADFETASGQKVSSAQVQDYLENTLKPYFDKAVKSGNTIYVKDTEGNIIANPGLVEELRHAPNYKLELINHKQVGGSTTANHKTQLDIELNNLNQTTAIDNARQANDLFEEVNLDIPPNEILALPGVLDNMLNLNDNVAKERKQRKVEAKMTIIGNPQFQTSKQMKLGGFAKKHNGLWYTTRVSHKLSPSSGYICDMDIIKKPTPGNKVGSVRTNKLQSKLNDIQTQAQLSTAETVNKYALTNELLEDISAKYHQADGSDNLATPVTGDENIATPTSDVSQTGIDALNFHESSNDAPATSNQNTSANSSSGSASNSPNSENN